MTIFYLDTELSFGKYKGVTLKDLIKIDPSYVIYLDNNSAKFSNAVDNSVIDVLKAHYGKTYELDTEIEIGKHKGKSVEKVIQINHAHLHWLYHNLPKYGGKLSNEVIAAHRNKVLQLFPVKSLKISPTIGRSTPDSLIPEHPPEEAGDLFYDPTGICFGCED